MNNTNEERMIKKIRKLFELANDDASLGNESSNALRMANALLAKHHIEMHRLAIEDEIFASFLDYPIKQAWIKSVIATIARFYNCRPVFDYNWEPAKTLIIGTSSNRITSILVIDQLLDQIKKETRGERITYRNGAALGLQDKCSEIILERDRDTGHDEVIPGTGLTIISIEKKMKIKNDEFIKKNFPNLSRGKGMRSASSEGRAYGRGLNPNARVGNTTRRLS